MFERVSGLKHVGYKSINKISRIKTWNWFKNVQLRTIVEPTQQEVNQMIIFQREIQIVYSSRLIENILRKGQTQYEGVTAKLER